MTDTPQRTGPARALVIAWLLAGTLDIIAAISYYALSTGRNPVVVLLYIASGVFGREAFSGGTLMAILGGVFHYTIALGWSMLFLVAYPRMKFLAKSKLMTGIGYGLFIWLVMNLVVLPLSKVAQPSFDPVRVATGIIILMVCVGAPISLVIGRYYARQPIRRT